jgi:predicted metalloprotease
MELELISRGSKVLFSEECPVCKQRHFLTFVKPFEGTYTCGKSSPGPTPCPQDKAVYIQCFLCNSLFKIPEKLRTNKDINRYALYQDDPPA